MPTIEIQGCETTFSESGEGEPILLLHCTGGTSGHWRGLTERLGGDYRILAPNRWGYGESAPWHGGGRLTLAVEAELVRAFARRQGRPLHLVGHSSGGAVALRAAALWPELVSSLVLIEPAAFHLLRDEPRDAGLYREIREVGDAVAHSLVRGDFTTGLGCFVDYWSGRGTWAKLAEDKRGALLRGIGRVALDFTATLEEPMRAADCRRITAATLLLCGERAPATTRRIASILERVLPDVRRQVVRGAGHMLPLSHGESVGDAVAAHLAAAAPPALRRAA
jgi:pimeloyl-ACP methyl ester carboxylesterase